MNYGVLSPNAIWYRMLDRFEEIFSLAHSGFFGGMLMAVVI